ncbi:MAG: heparan-alpha-glucosaminide N-acetyltransferase domain-containing protein [Actinomycetes bacterium]
MHDFNHPAAGTTRLGTSRLIGLDVTRAIALIGVVVMNYHGNLNDQYIGNDFWHRVFNVYSGVLSTRFAATFVFIAGIGTALLSRRAFEEKHEVSKLRIRLIRRGALLLLGGYFLNHAWPGTILFYYGAYFILSALFIMWKSRSIILVAITTAITATVVSSWEANRAHLGYSTDWMHPPNIHSIKDLFLRIFIDYTHPVFPWLAFFCLGIVIGRNLEVVRKKWRQISVVSCAVIFLCYVVTSILDHQDARSNPVIRIVTSMQPFTRGLFYTLTSAAIAVIAFLAISQVADKYHENHLIVHLQRSGQVTLSLYLLHVLVYYTLVKWSHFITATGLDTALIFAGVFWLFAIMIASWWQHHFGQAPAERLYRAIGG